MKEVRFYRLISCCAAAILLLTGCRGNTPASGESESLSKGESSMPSTVVSGEKIEISLTDYQSASGDRNDSALFRDAVTAAKRFVNEAKDSGKNLTVTLNLENKEYRFPNSLELIYCENLILNGNGASIVMESTASAFKLRNCTNVTLKDMSVDYDPLPFTQGVVEKIEGVNGRTVYLRVDAGYPADATYLNKGELYVMNFDRATKTYVEGYRSVVSVKNVEKTAEEGLLKLNMNLPINERWEYQTEVREGDVLVLRTGGVGAVDIADCGGTVFQDFTIYSAHGMGIYEFGGECGTKMLGLKVIPGSKPAGAVEDRLVSTNFDGTHFIGVKNGVTMDGCEFKACLDDPLNIHNFYYFVLEKESDQTYIVSPKWDVGLESGDDILLIDKTDFVTIGQSKIEKLEKFNDESRVDDVKELWKGKSLPTDCSLLYRITLADDAELEVGEAVTSMTRLGANTVVRNSSFDSCGRICAKGPGSLIENNNFSNTSGPAVYIGSDIGFWAESHFANVLTIRNNTFKDCGKAANNLAESDVLGVISISLVSPLDQKGFFENMENKNIIIENNTILNTCMYGIFVTNADGITVKGNRVENPFNRGLFNAGGHYGIVPDSGIFVGMSKNVEVSGNRVKSDENYIIKPVTLHESCDQSTSTQSDNILN